MNLNSDPQHEELRELLTQMESLTKELADLDPAKTNEYPRRKGELLVRLERLRAGIARCEMEIRFKEAQWEHRKLEFKHQKRMNVWNRALASIFVAGALWIGGHHELSHHSPDASRTPGQTEIARGQSGQRHDDDPAEARESGPPKGESKAQRTNSVSNLKP